MRLDKLLYCLRFAKTRGVAQRWIGEGHIRHNGHRATHNDRDVVPGDVLTLPLKSEVCRSRSSRYPPAAARLPRRALATARLTMGEQVP